MSTALLRGSPRAQHQLRQGAQPLRPAAGCRPQRRGVRLGVSAKLVADGPVVAIVGITGAVGQEFLRVIEQRNFPYSDLVFLASAKSAGQIQEFEGKKYTVKELTENSFGGVHISLFSAGATISKKYAPAAMAAGSAVVDNSSAFRMTDGIPLVIPEVNPEAMAGYKSGKPGLIANPNCSTIIALTAVTPLHRAAGVTRMVVSTYQAASGAGAAAMRELEQQTREALTPQGVTTMKIFPFQYAFNLFSHTTAIGENGYNEEEMKMVKETHKIWNTKDVAITATCIRVPVMRAHAESINLSFAKPLSEAAALDLLAKADGVSIINDRVKNRFPTPLDATDMDDVYVGRVRQDISQAEGKGLDLFVCGDQIRKGAALNAIQIAEVLIKNK